MVSIFGVVAAAGCGCFGFGCGRMFQAYSKLKHLNAFKVKCKYEMKIYNHTTQKLQDVDVETDATVFLESNFALPRDIEKHVTKETRNAMDQCFAKYFALPRSLE